MYINNPFRDRFLQEFEVSRFMTALYKTLSNDSFFHANGSLIILLTFNHINIGLVFGLISAYKSLPIVNRPKVQRPKKIYVNYSHISILQSLTSLFVNTYHKIFFLIKTVDRT